MRTTDTAVREMVHRRQRRRRTVVVSLVAVLVVTGAALVGAGLVRANNTAPDKAPSRVPAGAAADKSGLASSSGGAVRVDVYLDYLCPECRRTEQALAAALEALESDGAVRVIHHPVAFLDDRSSPAGYSTEAASAAACAADEGKFRRYSGVLFEKQPAEQGPGLGESELIAAGREAGITGKSFAACVREAPYRPWVRYVSDVAASRKVALTPTVMVESRRIDVTGPDPAAALTRAVGEARR